MPQPNQKQRGKRRKKRFRAKTPPGLFLASLSPFQLIPLDNVMEMNLGAGNFSLIYSPPSVVKNNNKCMC